MKDFERMAVMIARSPRILERLKSSLSASFDTAPLFQTEKYTRALEHSYESVWEIYYQNVTPLNLIIQKTY